jgi:acyl-homoserine-lactone acylase
MFLPMRSLVLCLLLGLVAAQAGFAGDVTVYRDSWGVPYIYGESDADVAYALGYAQAEDRLSDLFINVRIATGQLAEVIGPDGLESDYIMRMLKNAELCAYYWEHAPAETRAQGDAFVAGVNAYMAEHPDAVPPVALELQGWHAVAIMRAMILNWPLGTLQDEVKREWNSLGWGSNEWAVSPSRSAEGCAILLTDPHLTWEGMSVFYEANLYGDKIEEQHGFFLVGVYGMAYGHNGYVGWAPTTGGPDTADVFVMKLNPKNPMQYEYEGKFFNAVLGSVTIPVAGGAPVTKPTYLTHLGPALSEPDMETGTILVGSTPYLMDMELLDQMYAMLQAKDTTELYEAISLNHFMEQNFMYAGRDGNIGYARLGRCPIRPEGFDYTRPVPGNTFASRWLGLYSVNDGLRIVNPPQGYMQNCNISPENMMENSPFTPDKYPVELFNVSWDTRNSRGDRALQALAADDSLTKEEAVDLAFDITDPYWGLWKAALEKAVQNAGAVDDALQVEVEKILAWDGRYDRESQAATLVRFWRLAAFKKFPAKKVNREEALSDEELAQVLAAVSAGADHMQKTYGSTDVAWGDIIKVGRSGQFFPTSGADYGRGENDGKLRTLLSIGVKEKDDELGVYVAHMGSMAMSLMFFHEDGIESYTCIPWGQSADPESPHHMDQGEKLFSQRKFKPVYRSKEELLKNLSSEKVISAP